MHKGFLFVFILSLYFGASAQQSADTLRTFYVQEYPDDFFIWPVLKYRSLFFEVRDHADNEDRIVFRPNNAATFGLGFYVFEIGFEVTFAIPLGEDQINIFGESDARDLQANILGKSWGVDLYHQKYSGFYKDDSRVTIPKATPYPQRPDVNTRNFGVSGFYVFNHQKFSLRSSYNYAERQLISKGSVILYGTINSFHLTADSAILGEPAREGLGAGSDFVNLKYTTMSIAPGYSHNLVYKRFFVNGTFTLGPAHHWITVKPENGKERNDIGFNSTYSVRLAVGYSSDKIFGGIGWVVQSRVVRFEDIRFENSSQTLRILIGYRFRERGILEKRAWDFIPFFNR